MNTPLPPFPASVPPVETAETRRALEKRYRDTVADCRKLAAKTPVTYEPLLANACNTLAGLLQQAGKLREAEQLYCEALDLYKKLAARKRGLYEPFIAATNGYLGGLLSGAGRDVAAEWFYRAALDIWRKLAEKDEKYAPYVAGACQDLAVYLSDTGRTSETRRFFRVALDTRRKLAADNPEACEPDVAETCYQYGLFTIREVDKQDGKRLLEEALSLYSRHPRCAEDAGRVRRALKLYFGEE